MRIIIILDGKRDPLRGRICNDVDHSTYNVCMLKGEVSPNNNVDWVSKPNSNILSKFG